MVHGLVEPKRGVSKPTAYMFHNCSSIVINKPLGEKHHCQRVIVMLRIIIMIIIIIIIMIISVMLIMITMII